MRRRRGGGFAAVLCLGLAAAPAGAARGDLSGIVVAAGGAPVAGALVTVHESRSRRLVGQTYTADDGRFALAAPAAGGRYVAVATAGGRSARQAFAHASRAVPPLLELVVGGEEAPRWRRLLGYGWDKLDALLGTALGLVAGFWLRRFEERHKAKATLRLRRQALRGSAESARARLDELERRERRGSAAVMTTEAQQRIWAGIAGPLEELGSEREKLMAAEGLVVPALGWSAVDQYSNFQQELRKLEEAWATGAPGAATLAALRQALGRVAEHGFLKT
jgi:hypothetical protein